MTIDSDTFVKRVRAGQSLAGLDLTQVDPFIMDLSDLDLRGADLSRAHLRHASGGRMWAVGFTDTTRRARRHVRVRGASADLRDANFELADVRGVDFPGSNLEGARFSGAKSDESTVWPDGFEQV